MNKVILKGHLGKDPELKYTKNSNPVCNFSIATIDNFKDKQGEWHSVTDWHFIEVWGDLAERCNRELSKGSQVFIEGKIRTRSYQGSDSKKKYVTKIVAETMEFIKDSKNKQKYETTSDGFAPDDILF